MRSACRLYLKHSSGLKLVKHLSVEEEQAPVKPAGLRPNDGFKRRSSFRWNEILKYCNFEYAGYLVATQGFGCICCHVSHGDDFFNGFSATGRK